MSALVVITAFVLSFKALPPQTGAGLAQTGDHWRELAPEYPANISGRLSFFTGATFGTCRRDHSDVPAIGPCGEVSFGLEHRITARFVSSTELGIGFFPDSRSGDASYGIERRTGSPLFLAARYALGYDFTHRFFVRAGPQLRVAFAFGRPVPGVQLALDHGTRIERFELGVRLFVGVDGVAQTGPDSGRPHWSPAACLGVLLLARYPFT